MSEEFGRILSTVTLLLIISLAVRNRGIGTSTAQNPFLWLEKGCFRKTINFFGGYSTPWALFSYFFKNCFRFQDSINPRIDNMYCLYCRSRELQFYHETPESHVLELGRQTPQLRPDKKLHGHVFSCYHRSYAAGVS